MYSKLRNCSRISFEYILIIFILGFTVLIVLQQANPMLSYLGRDAGAFAYIGNQIRHGQVIYIDVWDSKPPGIFLINALGLSLIKGSRWGIWVVEYIFLSLSAFLGFITLRKIFGITPAITASLIWLYGLNAPLKGGNFTEEYSLLFGFLSLFLYIWSFDKSDTAWNDVGIGFCTGCSFLFRLNNIGPQVTIALTFLILSLIHRQYMVAIKRLTTIGIASLIPIGILAIYLLPRNAWNAFWEASIIYNLAYSGNQFDIWSSLASGLAIIGLSGGIALLGIVSAWWETGLKIKTPKDTTPAILLIALSAIIEVVLSGLSGRNFAHYFINWMPLIALASAFIISKVMLSTSQWLNEKPLFLLSALALLLLMGFNNVPAYFYQSIAPLLSHAKTTEITDALSQYLANKTTKDQTILAWGGEVDMNFLAGRNSPTPYLFYPDYVPSKITDRISRDFYNRLIANPPAYIIDESAGVPNHSLIPLNTLNTQTWLIQHRVYQTPFLLDTMNFIHSNYNLITNINDIDVYRLNR